MASTSYLRPASVDEATAMLHEHGYDAKVLAGGQSLIPMISLGLARPAVLVDIGRLAAQDGIELRDGTIRIQPLVRHRDLVFADATIAAAAPLLPAAGPHIGHDAIRARGTFVGSVAHGDPAGEWPAVALALDAVIELRSVAGTRTVGATDFFLGPLTTDVHEDELVTAVSLPACEPGTGASVLELAYRHGDYAVVGVVAQVTVGSNDTLDDVRIALFGVGSTPIRARAAEAVAREGAGAFPEAGRAAAGESDPASDATASATYRRDMVEVYVRRALEQALAAAHRTVPSNGHG